VCEYLQDTADVNEVGVISVDVGELKGDKALHHFLGVLITALEQLRHHLAELAAQRLRKHACWYEKSHLT
jgi:hypothetical protein